MTDINVVHQHAAPFLHITLNTGHVCYQHAADFTTAEVDALKTFVAQALKTEGQPLKLPKFGVGLSARISRHDDAYFVELLIADCSDKWRLLSFGVALKGGDGAVIWSKLHDNVFKTMSAMRPPVPAEPWIAVRLEPLHAQSQDIVPMRGLVEGCVAWALVALQSTNSSQPVSESNIHPVRPHGIVAGGHLDVRDESGPDLTIRLTNPSEEPSAQVRRGTASTTSQQQTQAILHRLAANQALTTTNAIRVALRKAGLPGRMALVEEVLNNRIEHGRLGRNREARRIATRTGRDVRSISTRSYPRNRPVLLPVGTPKARLEALRHASFKDAASSVLRQGAAGGSTFASTLTDRADDVGYVVEMGSNRDTYLGKFKGWRASEDHHRVTIPRHWLSRVLWKDLENVSGLLTLDAVAVSSGNPDVELYKAVWARQGRWYSVITERGFIARCRDYAFHAENAEKALSGLRRKMSASGKRTSRSTLALTDEQFIKRYQRRDPKCYVSISDARESGSCESGILQWCQAVGIDSARGFVPLHEMLEAFSREPQMEVRLAVIHAVRRHSRELRKVAA